MRKFIELVADVVVILLLFFVAILLAHVDLKLSFFWLTASLISTLRHSKGTK